MSADGGIDNYRKVIMDNLKGLAGAYVLSFAISFVVLVYIGRLPQHVTGNPDQIVDEYYLTSAPKALLSDLVFVAIYLAIGMFIAHVFKVNQLATQTLVIAATTCALTAFFCILFRSRPLDTSSFFSRWFHSVGFKSVVYDAIIVCAIFVVLKMLLQTKLFCNNDINSSVSSVTSSAEEPAPAMSQRTTTSFSDERETPIAANAESIDMEMNNKQKAAFFREMCFGAHVGEHNEKVQHAFADPTHGMCCLLGPKSRAYADNSGNPIGTASEEVAQTAPTEVADSAMTSWSSCMGSNVCSYYGKRFGDAYPKFAVSPDKKKMWIPTHGTIVSPECEKFLQEDVFKGTSHLTPGIEPPSSKHGCSPEDQAKILKDVIDTPF